jgi:Fic family protein
MKYIWQKQNWFDFKYNQEKLMEPLAKVRYKQGELLGQINFLDFESEIFAQTEVLIEEAIHTAEIEGLILNKDAVRSSIAVRLGLPQGIVVRDRNVDGLVDVLLDAVKFYEQPLTISRLNGWQASLFPSGYSGFKQIRVGKFRGEEPMQVVSGAIGKEKIHFEAPPYLVLKKEMDDFLKWWRNSECLMDGILRAGKAHLYFVTIHPYEDGNGRIARIITDMALAQDEKIGTRFYSISSKILKMRDEYYDILENVQKGKIDATDWFVWFLKCVDLAIDNSQNILQGVLIRVRFWQKFKDIEINERQKKVIKVLLEAEPSGFIGGLTNRKYVSIAKTSRATALREINDLLQKKILCQLAGEGRNIKYEISRDVVNSVCKNRGGNSR